MKPVDICILSVIFLLLAGIIVYLVRSKKKGRKCIGCPDSCSGNCQGCHKG